MCKVLVTCLNQDLPNQRYECQLGIPLGFQDYQDKTFPSKFVVNVTISVSLETNNLLFCKSYNPENPGSDNNITPPVPVFDAL